MGEKVMRGLMGPHLDMAYNNSTYISSDGQISIRWPRLITKEKGGWETWEGCVLRGEKIMGFD